MADLNCRECGKWLGDDWDTGKTWPDLCNECVEWVPSIERLKAERDRLRTELAEMTHDRDSECAWACHYHSLWIQMRELVKAAFMEGLSTVGDYYGTQATYEGMWELSETRKTLEGTNG